MLSRTYARRALATLDAAQAMDSGLSILPANGNATAATWSSYPDATLASRLYTPALTFGSGLFSGQTVSAEAHDYGSSGGNARSASNPADLECPPFWGAT